MIEATTPEKALEARNKILEKKSRGGGNTNALKGRIENESHIEESDDVVVTQENKEDKV